MSRRVPLIAFALGVLALGLVVAFGSGGSDTARAILAAWLVLVAAPLGALPMLMGLELAGRGMMPGASALRLILSGLPVAALFGVAPLLALAFAPHAFDLTALYAWNAGGLHGLAARWFTRPWFSVRALVILAVFVALGLTFMRDAQAPPRWRRPIAALGLALYLCLGSLAAVDWISSLDPGLNLSAFGLLLLTLQVAFAATLALLISLACGPGVPRSLVVILLAAVAAAAFMQFVQYLVVWSANLPLEIVWYQHRLAGLGTLLFEAAPVVLVVAFVALGLATPSRLPAAAAAGLLLALEIADLLWLVTPAWRGSFSITGLDGLSLVGLGGLIAASAILLGPRTRVTAHG